MPRFYLHLCNGNGFNQDVEGEEHESLEAAREGAIAALRDVSAEEMRKGMVFTGSFIEIESETGHVLDTVQFADAVTLKSGEVPG